LGSEVRAFGAGEEWSRLTTDKNDKPDVAKPSVTLPGTVEKIIPPPHPSQPEKAQIGVEGADDLYREIRVQNTLTDEDGKPVALKAGGKVEVTIEADPSATKPKQDSK
jgi:hypothetical protein